MQNSRQSMNNASGGTLRHRLSVLFDQRGFTATPNANSGLVRLRGRTADPLMVRAVKGFNRHFKADREAANMARWLIREVLKDLARNDMCDMGHKVQPSGYCPRCKAKERQAKRVGQ